MGKHHTATFKAHLVRELLREDKTISQLAAEHGIHPNQLSKWKAVALQQGFTPLPFVGNLEWDCPALWL